MKKLFYFAAAAVALAACAKNEVIPVNSGENQEITFNVAPKTKADPAQDDDGHKEFGKGNVFASWAYYLHNQESGTVTNWSENWTVRQGAKPYISNSEISCKNGVWKNQTTSYYWPKDGALTFFAYSLNRANLSYNSGNTTPIDCLNTEGSYGINATIDLKENQNLDLLVAEIAADKTHNEDFQSLNGVPTLFKHKFSRVQFAVKKKANCGNATITLNSIKFYNVVYYGTYCQYNYVNGTFVNDYCSKDGARTTITYTETPFVVKSSDDFDPVIETNESNYIYFPQNFINVQDQTKIATIEVKYTVKFSDDIKEEHTKILNVKEIFDSWDVGKKYIFNLIFSLDEITWAPAVEEWESVTKEIDIKYRDL